MESVKLLRISKWPVQDQFHKNLKAKNPQSLVVLTKWQNAILVRKNKGIYIMKKTVFGLLLTGLALTVNAQHRHHYHHYHHYHQHRHNHNMAILGAAVLGAGVGYVLTRPPQVVIQEPVYVQPPTYTYIERNDCTEWREIITSDGRLYRERICR